MASKGSGAEGYLLSVVPSGLSPGALPGKQTALHRRRGPTKESSARREVDLPDGLLPRPSMRRLRRDRSDRARVRSPPGQEVRHCHWDPEPQLERRAWGDCKVWRRLCKLSSSPHRKAGRLPPRGG